MKPNCVSATAELSATSAQALAAVLEFVAAHDPRRIIVGEGSAEDTRCAFANFGYARVAEQFAVELVDLNQDQTIPAVVYDRRGRPHSVPVARTALESVRVSLTRPKTHDTVIVTAGLKNLAVGAITRPHKVEIHQGYAAINVNLALLAGQLFPHLSVIDGFVGMEGAGPTSGDPVDHRMALAGCDPVAVDAVCAHLMGFDPRQVGYLVHAARLGVGVGDLGRVEVIGGQLEQARRGYRPHPTYREQLRWRPPQQLAQAAGLV
ncbi:MAG: DUF362 domain-containing protein [Candidatus Bipolaricaulaceae bacterium]